MESGKYIFRWNEQTLKTFEFIEDIKLSHSVPHETQLTIHSKTQRKDRKYGNFMPSEDAVKNKYDEYDFEITINNETKTGLTSDVNNVYKAYELAHFERGVKAIYKYTHDHVLLYLDGFFVIFEDNSAAQFLYSPSQNSFSSCLFGEIEKVNDIESQQKNEDEWNYCTIQ